MVLAAPTAGSKRHRDSSDLELTPAERLAKLARSLNTTDIAAALHATVRARVREIRKRVPRQTRERARDLRDAAEAAAKLL
jgi:hypothetical protein